MKCTATMNRKEMLEYIGHLKGMIRTLQADTRLKMAKAPINTPCAILTDEVIAAHRLPMTLKRMDVICAGTPKDARCEQRGDWFLVLKGKGKEA